MISLLKKNKSAPTHFQRVILRCVFSLETDKYRMCRDKTDEEEKNSKCTMYTLSWFSSFFLHGNSSSKQLPQNKMNTLNVSVYSFAQFHKTVTLVNDFCFSSFTVKSIKITDGQSFDVQNKEKNDKQQEEINT